LTPLAGELPASRGRVEREHGSMLHGSSISLIYIEGQTPVSVTDLNLLGFHLLVEAGLPA
jgi:hypothetical protein